MGVIGTVLGMVIGAAILGAYGQLWSANAINAQYQERLKTPEAEVDKLKVVPANTATITTALNTAAGEVEKLRGLWVQAQSAIVECQSESKGNTNEIVNIRSQAVADGQDIAKLREQVAAIQATEAERKPATK